MKALTAKNIGESKSEQANRLNRVARSLFLRRLRNLPENRIEWKDDDLTRAIGQRDVPAEDLRPVTVEVLDPRFYRRPFVSGALGVAEGYIEGEWHCLRHGAPDPTALTDLFRLLLRSREVADGLRTSTTCLVDLWARLKHGLKANSLAGSKKNIHAHYDLGNDFFRLFLDETMAYSCGLFENQQTTLEQASIAKFRRLQEVLDLQPSDHLLEIGTGWGGFAVHAAQNIGCRVTTTTISSEQHKIARERVSSAGLEDRVTVLLQDYRHLEGQYDKAVAIEMIEAVGHSYLPQFFGAVCQLLKPSGRFALQAITMPDHRYRRYLGSVDFIRAFVFPGSCCPSISAMTAAISQRSDFRLVQLDDIGRHYVRTLQCWRDRFLSRLDDVRAQGFPESFIRLWHYYLCYCEAGFAERYTSNVHMLLERSGANRPPIQGQS